MPTQIAESFVMERIPQRQMCAHKGNFGRVLMICGSVGYTGAPCLAASGALRTGSGLVYLCVPETVYPIVATKMDEAMVFPLPAKNGACSHEAVDIILTMLPNMDAVLIGPGMGRNEGTLTCVRTVLQHSGVPVILDADGINVLSEHIDLLRDSACPVILTPHEGEFKTLIGHGVTNREEDAKKFAVDTGCICVLKGHGTVVTDGDACLINTTGNPGMAVGGSGDVLAGMIASLCGQGIAPLDAAACAVWLHGKAGDICAAELGQYSMLPTDMIQALPRLLP